MLVQDISTGTSGTAVLTFPMGDFCVPGATVDTLLELLDCVAQFSTFNMFPSELLVGVGSWKLRFVGLVGELRAHVLLAE